LGDPGAPDTEIMASAADNDFVVLTHDLDFGSILAATNGSKPSVVQLRAEDLAPERIGQAVVSALIQVKQALADGALLTIDPKRARLRLLPLRDGD
jgi:predicted nuclease of predicted toxin-antitoxin system